MLEQIKADFEYAQGIEGEGYGYKGLSDEQVKWLIEQSGKVGIYKKALREIAEHEPHCEELWELGYIDYYDGYSKTRKAKNVLKITDNNNSKVNKALLKNSGH